MDCGCEDRRKKMNSWIPGSGDLIKLFADPVAKVIYGEKNMNSKMLTYAAIFLAGVMLSGKVGSLPLINKLPRL